MPGATNTWPGAPRTAAPSSPRSADSSAEWKIARSALKPVALAPGLWDMHTHLSLQDGPKPEVLTTVFAGQDLDATERARQYITGYPPSSPAVALFKDQELVWMMERHQIEGRHPDDIAADLRAAYQEHC